MIMQLSYTNLIMDELKEHTKEHAKELQRLCNACHQDGDELKEDAKNLQRLCGACENGDELLVKKLLENQERELYLTEKTKNWKQSNFHCTDIIAVKNHHFYNVLNNCFQDACTFGHLSISKLIFQHYTILPNNWQPSYLGYSYAFRCACERGHLDVAQWLYSVKPELDISSAKNYAFRSAFIHGHLEVAQWLYSVKPDMDMVAFRDAFRHACDRGYLSMAQWLLLIKPELEVSFNKEETFWVACSNNHLSMVQWLLSIKPDMDVSMVDKTQITDPTILALLDEHDLPKFKGARKY